ncbi:sensor histidine kinase [Pontiella sulfatireligans]|uniref:sensor histidine kinase n=1 Tax=Pontiella sulfatireligans TaxID=2750658 RepID=UPI0014443207|nr:PAS domain-containing sensor histidine kinase [Pontiella sulfatireligans]
MQAEQEAQKRIAFTAGLLQGDITIRTFMESLAEGVVVINIDGRIILINQRMEELLGYSKIEVQGESISLFIPERLRAIHDKHISSYFSHPRIRPMGIGLDLTGQRKDGKEIPVEVSLSNLEVDSGRIGLAFITDISARKAAETKLKKKNKQLDEFASIVAHDLNSDVSAIVGLSEMLIDAEDDFSAEETREYLQEIANGGRKLSEIIRELLLFARMEKGDCVFSRLKMTSLIAPVQERLKREIADRSASISIDESGHTVMGYGPWLEEVWFNYLSNALKYGGTPPIIEIGSRKENDTVVFWIKDNGPGIAAEDLELVFNDGNDARKRIIKGNGIGLTIVKRIVEQLSGKAWVTSEPGQGSVFYLSLPSA